MHAFSQHGHAEERDEGHREQKGADEGRDNGVRHRGEDSALLALQGEDREVGDDDDEHREQGGPTNLRGRFQNGPLHGLGKLMLGPFAELSEDVLDHDDGAVHDDAEVHRPQGEKICGDALETQSDEGRQKREGNDDGDDGRRAKVTQKKVKDPGYQQCPLQEVDEHRFQGRFDQPRAVVEGDDFDPFGEDGPVQSPDSRLDRVENVRRVLPFAHEHDARHGLVVVVLPDDSLPRDGRHAGLGDVTD